MSMLRHMPRKGGRILGFLVIQVTLILLLLEGGLRLLGPHVQGLNVLLYSPSRQTNLDEINDLPTLMGLTMLGFKPLRRWRDFILNSRSMRTREYVGEGNPDVFRIVISGDSFAFGSGGSSYEKMWTIELERALNQNESGEIEVLSLGVAGVAPVFALRLWEIERDLLQADLVHVQPFRRLPMLTSWISMTTGSRMVPKLRRLLLSGDHH